MVYFGNAVSLLVLYIIIGQIPVPKKQRELYFLNTSFFSMFMLLAVRDKYTFPDLSSYLFRLHYHSDMSLWETLEILSWEPLYITFFHTIGSIYLNDRFFLIVTAFFSLIGPYCFIKRYSTCFLISVLMYALLFGWYDLSFYILRQSLAFSILFCSIKYIEEQKFWKFSLFVMLATFTHKSSILFISLYFIAKIKKTKMVIGIYLCYSCVFLVFGQQILSFVMSFYYSSYAGRAVRGEGLNLLLFMIGLCFIILYLSPSSEKKTLNDQLVPHIPIDNIALNAIFLSILLQIVCVHVSLVSRFVISFSPFFMIALPNTLMKQKYHRKEWCVLCVCGILLMGYFFATARVPYVFMTGDSI